tara:strand:+ start:653 stop:958 length:306 start_codon:yes stop_codon:yes gene_type:complete
MEINLIKDLEKISLNFPNRILKIKGYAYEKQKKEFLEIIIYKGFSSSTTHPIEIDSEKNIIHFKCYFSEYELFEAPLSEINNNFIKRTTTLKEILEENFWI